MQVYSENLYSNENNYSEPFETVNNYSETVNNYRRAQSQCSLGDQNDERTIYSYNHLHEKPIQI